MHVDEHGNYYQDFKALTNELVRQALNITSIESEMTFRRLRWLQQSVQHEADAVNYLAALQGQALWEKEPTITSSGELGINANPWTRQAFSDLHWLAACENGDFATQWKLTKWWSIYTTAFRTAKLNVVKFNKVPQGKLITFSSADVLCRNVVTCSFLPQRQKTFQPNRGSPPGMETADTWMELPMQHVKDELPVDDRGKPVPKLKGGKGKPSHASSSVRGRDRLTDKALLNLDARLRAQEDITEDSFDVPASLQDIEAALRVGPNYNIHVKNNKGKKIGPPHTFLWVALVRGVSKQPDCPPDLKQQALNYLAKQPTSSEIKRLVPFCTLHRQYNDNTRAALAVNVRPDMIQMWNNMRRFYFQRGAKEFEGTISRGPIFRQILRRVHDDD